MTRICARVFAFAFCAALAAGCTGSPQGMLPAAPASGISYETNVTVEAGDIENARSARILSYHLMPLRNGAPTSRIRNGIRLRYPADLRNHGGPIMKTAASFNIYVNCNDRGERCWGDPEGFQRNLTGSTFAALLEQYTDSSPDGYTFGGAFSVRYHTYTKIFYGNDLLAVLHAALVENGKKAGYANLYHIFLPRGTDTCFDRSRVCYSPDHPATNYFCAYHESVAFKDVSDPVIVSVEPYQKVAFCASRASSGASALTNSTASTLGHETFESITDPGPRLAWYNFTFNSEVADLCQTYEWRIALNKTVYSLQPMYSNHYHACAAAP
jgi:hypothetical protein